MTIIYGDIAPMVTPSDFTLFFRQFQLAGYP